LLQVTEVASADAVPPMAMVGAEIETIVNAGEVIFMPGGVPDTGEDGGVFCETVCRVTVTTREATFPALSAAVTVIMFIPRCRGTT